MLTSQFEVSEQQAEQAALLADGSLTRALELARHTRKDLTDNVRGWLRLCFTGELKGIQAMAQDFNRQPKEEQLVFVQFALNSIRNAALHLWSATDIALETPTDAQFSANFHKVFTGQSITLAAQALEDAEFHLRRNANATMVFTALSLRLHRAMNKLREPV